MNPNQARAIAAAVSRIRPDWFETSLNSLLWDGLPSHRRDLPARDVMLALVWLAYDPDTDKPGRLKLDGPWWHLAETAAKTAPAPVHVITQWCDRHGRPYLHECRYCRDVQPPSTRGVPPSPEHKAAIRAAIDQAQDRNTRKDHP